MVKELHRIIPEDPDNPYRLGRNVYHDARSARFPFAARPEAKTPVVSRPAWQRQVGILDQGQIGACTGFAGTGWVGTNNADRYGITGFATAPSGQRIGPRPDGSVDSQWALRLYSEATQVDPWPGSYRPGEPDSEDTGSDGTSVAKILHAWGLCQEYTWAFAGLLDVLAALQAGPVLLGTHWYDSMFHPAADGEVRVSAGAAVVGGHEYVATGEIDMTEQWIGCANSWGTGWGVGGYFRLSFDTVSRLLAEDGDATVLHAVAVIKPTPDPDAPFQVRLPAHDREAVVRRARKRGVPAEEWLAWLVHWYVT